jgi:hypothetical protein
MSDDTSGTTSKIEAKTDWRHLRSKTDEEIHAAIIDDPDVRHAAAAIASGLCETVLITHGESGRSGVGDVVKAHRGRDRGEAPVPTLPSPARGEGRVECTNRVDW